MYSYLCHVLIFKIYFINFGYYLPHIILYKNTYLFIFTKFFNNKYPKFTTSYYIIDAFIA